MIATQLAEARQALDAMQAHAATQARLETDRTELEAGRRQLEALRTQFLTELERATSRWRFCRNGQKLASGAASANSTRNASPDAAVAQAEGRAVAEHAQRKTTVELGFPGGARRSAGPSGAKRKRRSRAICWPPYA